MNIDQIQLFLSKNNECFDPYQLKDIKQMLDGVDESKSAILFGIGFQKPTIILIIAIILGWDRFFLGDIGLGILKVITCYGCGIWWLVDVFTAKRRTFDYNIKKLRETLILCK